MPKPNNPYRRPIDATKESAMLQMEHGPVRRATDKALNHAAGPRDVSPASRYQVVGNAYESPKAVSKPKPKAKPYHGRDKESESAVTAEDLFG